MEITKSGNYFRIAFHYNPYLVERVKLLPERRFDPVNKCWIVPATQLDAVQHFAAQHNFTFCKSDQVDETYAEIPPMPVLTTNIPLKLSLFPYQGTGVAYALEKKKLIIGDQPGLGKTAQAIATVTGASAFPCLVICPSSLKVNWEREWEMWTDKKCIILNDSVKRNFNLFWEANLAQVFIVNYESLKKYFVESIDVPKGQKLRINHIKFKKQFVGMFKSVIIDESHRCFPYDTEIMTNKGPVKIGDIVENNLTDLLVQSVNLSNKSVSLKEIKTLWKNETGFKQLYKIKHEYGEFTATENHEVYTSAGRYKEVSEIKSGDYLFMLRGEILNGEGREVNGEMLLKKLFVQNGKCKAGNKSATARKSQPQRIKGVRIVRGPLPGHAVKQKQILRKELFCKMEDVATRGKRCKQNTGKQGEYEDKGYYSDAESRTQKNALRQDEIKQSYTHARSFRKDFSKNERQAISIKRRERTNYGTTNEAMGSLEFTGNGNRISNFNGIGKVEVSKCSSLLQIGYRYSGNKTFNRSGRAFSQSCESKNHRSVQNGGLELVRVESCEVYQSANFNRLADSSGRIEKVYDLEIDGNNNYFANGILVSNCKSSATQQSKFTKGICSGKEYILALTGTPVINKPKDLISQLGIIDQMGAFGGYQAFTNRYCSGVDQASNLRELNYKLNLTCFYRRDKQDVLKDLPDKMRQVAICEISTRKEYQSAEDDLIKYLKDYKEATDGEIARSMRGEIMVRIGILKNISARGKLADVFSFVDDIIESGEKLVLFGNLHEVMNAIKAHYPKAVSVTGMDDMASRQQAVDSFQKNPAVQLIVCSIKAAGVGLTLTASSRVAFVELPWTAADTDQCEDRCHRIGQKDSVTCTYFLGQNTIDEKIHKIIQSKREMAKTITGATEQVEENILDMVVNLFNQEKGV